MEEGVHTKEYKICKDLHNKNENGVVRLHAATPFPILETLIDGYFSFVLYQEGADDPNNFLTSMNKPLIAGIDFYIRMLHTEEAEDRLKRWGVIVYTDTKAYQYLRKVFPFELYPKLIIAVVVWPHYSHKDGRVDYSILRCMRFQAMELFPTKAICARDSDTIFHVALHKYVKDKRHKNEIISLIRKWELAFIDAWLGSYTAEELADLPPTTEGQIKETVVFGASNEYGTEWHVDVPYPIPFINNTVAQYNLINFFKRKEHPLKFVGRGLYAGFVNIGADKTKIGDMWKLCVDYLLERYIMTKPKEGASHIGDCYAHGILGSEFGKDEKLLMFVAFPYTMDNAYIMYIEYPVSNPSLIQAEEDPSVPPEIQRNTMIRPGYVQAAIKYKNPNTDFPAVSDEFKSLYKKTVEEYKAFLATWKPKEFYDAIQAHIEAVRKGPVRPEQYFMKQYVHPTRFHPERSNKTSKIPNTPGTNSRRKWRNILTSKNSKV